MDRERIVTQDIHTNSLAEMMKVIFQTIRKEKVNAILIHDLQPEAILCYQIDDEDGSLLLISETLLETICECVPKPVFVKEKEEDHPTDEDPDQKLIGWLFGKPIMRNARIAGYVVTVMGIVAMRQAQQGEGHE